MPWRWPLALAGLLFAASVGLAACGRKPREASTPAPAEPSAAAEATGDAPVPDVPAGPAPTISDVLSPASDLAGYIFGVPVPLGNYYFAKRVLLMFPHPGEEDLDAPAQEEAIWEALVLHYESFRRGVTVSDGELEQWINGVLHVQQQPFTRSQDPAAYAAWVQRTLQEDVVLFENQMRYLYQIQKLKEMMLGSFQDATDEQLERWIDELVASAHVTVLPASQSPASAGER